MIIPMLGGYIFGGFFCGIVLSIVYCFHFVRNRRRLPWSVFLAGGWLLCVVGAILMLVSQSMSPGKNVWQDNWGFGSVGVGLGFWWVCASIYFLPRLWVRLLDFGQK